MTSSIDDNPPQRSECHKRRVHILMSGPLTYGAAGLANSVISRSTALSNAGWEVVLLIDVWQPDLDRHVELLKSSRRLGQNVEVRNLYEDLSRRSAGMGLWNAEVSASPMLNDYVGDLEKKVDSTDARIVRFYDGNRYKYFAYRPDCQDVSFIDELVDGSRRRRLFFDTNGKLIRALRYEGDRIRDDEGFDGNGDLYYRQRSEMNGQSQYLSVRSDKRSYQRLAGESSLLYFWLNACFGWEDSDVIISEYAFRFDHLERLKQQQRISVIYTLHNSHLAYPHNLSAPLKPELETTFRNAPHMDALVVLTPQQKFDIQKSFPSLNNIHVIPHATPAPMRSDGGEQKRETGLIALVGRLSKVKGQVRVVEQFSRVLERLPGARLELWGRGEAEGEIADMISRKGLEENVKLCGFATDPTHVYQRAEVALFPSLYEGQPLALMEAMHHGCVPVCFDFKYGARMMVDDLIDGVIVERDDLLDMLDSAAVLISDRRALKHFSRNAVRKSGLFSESRLVGDWDLLLSRLARQRLGTE